MTTPRPTRSAAALVALAAALATSPSALAAPAVTVAGKCYAYWPGEGSQPIPVTLTGFAPGQGIKLELQVRGKTVSGLPSLTADSTGAVVTSLDNWTSGLGTGPTRSTEARVVASDFILGTAIAAADLKVANVGIQVDSAAKSARVKRLWEVSGLSLIGGGSDTYYAFYFKGKKQLGKQRIGRAQDACGYVQAKKVLIPFRRFGTFNVRIQASPRWRGDKLPWVGGKVTSYRTRS